MQNPPTVRIGGQVSKSLYQFSMQSPNREELYKASRDLKKALTGLPGIEDLTSDLEISSPQVNVEIDRDKAAALGVTANQIESAFYDAYGPRWVSTIYAPVNEYKVLLELAPQFQNDPAALSMLYFKATPQQGGGAAQTTAAGTAAAGGAAGGANAAANGAGGALGAGGANSTTAGVVVPLDTLAKTTQVVGPQTVNHHGQLPAVTISFGLAPGASLGDVLTRVQKVADETLPEGVSGAFQGAAKAFESSLGNLAVLLVIAIMVVYIVLGILYESYIHPLTILSGPAVGGVRRAGHADGLPDGSEHLRVRRHDHADRHRREERDHADRLRARGRARRQEAGRSDLRRLPDPLPADHDDDDGGAARARCRSRSATAPAAKRGSRSASWSSAACCSRSWSRCSSRRSSTPTWRSCRAG